MFAYKDVIGQNEIKKYLKKVKLLKRLSHAYIIEGERGMGKTALAKAWAANLLCEKEGEEACGICHSCKQVEAITHPDLKIIAGEKPTLISVGEIREKICDDIRIRPFKGRFKIYIIKEAHKMNIQAQNAILKTLEEPPAYAIIILLCDNSEVFLNTLRSRCIKLKLRPQPDALIEERLREVCPSREKAELYIRFSGGNIGKALRLATIEEDAKNFEENIKIMENLLHADELEMKHYADILKDRKDIYDFFDFSKCWYRDVLILKIEDKMDKLLFKNKYRALKNIAEASEFFDIDRILGEIDAAKSRIEFNVNKEAVIKTMLAAMKKR